MAADLDLPARPVEFPAGPLTVRAASRADTAAMFAAATESAVELSTTMAWWRDDLTADHVEQWLAFCESAWDDGKHFEFTVADPSVADPDGQFLGSLGIGPVRWSSLGANLSYWVRTSRTGQGVGSTAARAVARWACERLGLQRVEITVVTSNVPSQRLAARSGATREGVLRNALRWADQPYDAAVFSFVPADFTG